MIISDSLTASVSVEELEEFKDGEKEVRSAVDDFDSKTCFIGTRNKYLRSLYSTFLNK